MRFNLLLLLAILFGATSFSLVSAQTGTYEGPLRGEMAAPPTDNIELSAALETVKLDLIINEIEDAGFSMDVNEGFDEEWEEEIWVASDADDVDALLLSTDESDLMEADEVISQDELLEEWEDLTWTEPEIVLEESEAGQLLEGNATEEQAWEEELWGEEIGDDEPEFALLNENSDDVAEDGEWWNSNDEYDESWDELQDEWELDALEDAYESEDMEYMEMMYGM
jgi:hypothetical protein